jgi:twitching motility protein PilI
MEPSRLRVKQVGKLREFSLQLAERIKAAPNTPVEPMRLAVRVGSDAYLIDMGLAGEIVPVPAIAPVPWTKPWFRGLANVRGRLIGVIDMPQLSGRDATPNEQGQQLLVFGAQIEANAGILITRAFGLRNISEMEALGNPGDATRPWETMRYRDMDGTVLTEVDLFQLVQTEKFAGIGV